MHKTVVSIEAWATEKAEDMFNIEMQKINKVFQESKVYRESDIGSILVKISTNNHDKGWKDATVMASRYFLSPEGLFAKELKKSLVPKLREQILADLVNKIEGIDDQLEDIRNEINHIHRNH